MLPLIRWLFCNRALVSNIGVQLNRPKTLNAFGGNLLMDVVTALRELNEHPDTVFTVITGEGRFFSSGADVKGKLEVSCFPNPEPTRK